MVALLQIANLDYSSLCFVADFFGNIFICGLLKFRENLGLSRRRFDESGPVS